LKSGQARASPTKEISKEKKKAWIYFAGLGLLNELMSCADR
jgi:hypothetical protein